MKLIENVERNLTYILNVWENNHKGFAPKEVSLLLDKIEFSSAASMASMLVKWDKEDFTIGESILASVNIGSIVEFMLLFFLIIYLNDYVKDTKYLKNHKKQKKYNDLNKELNDKSISENDKKITENEIRKLIDEHYKKPTNLTFDNMREFIKTIGVFENQTINWILEIQQRRNKIHLHKSSFFINKSSYQNDIENLDIFIKTIINHLPPIEDFT